MKPVAIDVRPTTIGKVQMFRIKYDDGSIRTEAAPVALAALRHADQVEAERSANLLEDRSKARNQMRHCIARGEEPTQARASLAAIEAEMPRCSERRARIQALADQVRAAACLPHARTLREKFQAAMAETAAQLPPIPTIHPENPHA